MRSIPLLFAVVLGSCSGTINEAEAPNWPALECQRRLAGTQLPASFADCQPRGLAGQDRGRPVCRFESGDREVLYAQCMGAAGWPPKEPSYGGGASCTVIYSEDGACSMQFEEWAP
jgi:hypothetical protein